MTADLIAPAPTDPFRLGNHLIDGHGIEAFTVDHLDSDQLRRMHAVLHGRRTGHDHGRN